MFSISPHGTLFLCSKRSKVRVHRIRRKKRICGDQKVHDKTMELKNLKLYMENLSILRENEKLRNKASLLHQENLALLAQFENKPKHLIKSLSATLQFQDTRIK